MCEAPRTAIAPKKSHLREGEGVTPQSSLRTRRVDEAACQEWAADHAAGRAPPNLLKAVAKVGEAGIRNAAFMDFRNYLRRRVDGNRCPEPRGFLNSLLPRAAAAGLVHAAVSHDARQ